VDHRSRRARYRQAITGNHSSRNGQLAIKPGNRAIHALTVTPAGGREKDSGYLGVASSVQGTIHPLFPFRRVDALRMAPVVRV
jgi:hypothetical protein